jgi:hypothetical protein
LAHHCIKKVLKLSELYSLLVVDNNGFLSHTPHLLHFLIQRSKVCIVDLQFKVKISNPKFLFSLCGEMSSQFDEMDHIYDLDIQTKKDAQSSISLTDLSKIQDVM